MMKIEKEKKHFKREYIPVIFCGIVLVLLICALVYVIGYNHVELEEVPENTGHVIEEININVKNSKCSVEEVKDLSASIAKIEMTYEPEEVVVGKGWDIDTEGSPEVDLYGIVWNVTFKNVPENVYIRFYNETEYEEDKENVVLKAKEEDNGIITYQTKYQEDPTTYIVEVHSDVSNCAGETFRKMSLVSPIFNSWSENVVCETLTEFAYCSKYTTETIPAAKFYSELNKYKKEHPNEKTAGETIAGENKEEKEEEKNTIDKVKESIANHQTLVLVILIVAIVGAIVVTVILLKKKRSKKI